MLPKPTMTRRPPKAVYFFAGMARAAVRSGNGNVKASGREGVPLRHHFATREDCNRGELR